MAALSKRKMVRTSTVARSASPQYDAGTFYFIAFKANEQVWSGILEVEYSVKLEEPQAPEGEINLVRITAGGTIATAYPLGTFPTYVGDLNLVTVNYALSNQSITFLRGGRYLIYFHLYGTSLAENSYTWAGDSGIDLLTDDIETVNTAATSVVFNITLTAEENSVLTISHPGAGTSTSPLNHAYLVYSTDDTVVV